MKLHNNNTFIINKSLVRTSFAIRLFNNTSRVFGRFLMQVMDTYVFIFDAHFYFIYFAIMFYIVDNFA